MFKILLKIFGYFCDALIFVLKVFFTIRLMDGAFYAMNDPRRNVLSIGCVAFSVWCIYKIWGGKKFPLPKLKLGSTSRTLVLPRRSF